MKIGMTVHKGRIDIFCHALTIVLLLVVGNWQAVSAQPGSRESKSRDVKSPPDLNATIRECDQLWCVSTESICPLGFEPGSLVVHSRQQCQWVCDSLDGLLTQHQSDDLPTIVYVHGNQTNSEWARARGLQVYGQLAAAAPCQPFRLVVWAWPSDDFGDPVRNYVPNVNRSINEGFALAWFLDTAGRTEKTRLFAYSLGCQVLLSALEYLPCEFGNPGHYRVLALAPVVACRWPSCDCQVKTVYDELEHLVIVRNRRDYVVNLYRAGCQLARPRMAPIGIRQLETVDNCEKVESLDVVRWVGRVHGVQEYFKCRALAAQVAQYLTRPSCQCDSNAAANCESAAKVVANVAGNISQPAAGTPSEFQSR